MVETIVTGWNKFQGTWFARAYATDPDFIAAPYGFVSATSDISAAEAVDSVTAAARAEARKYDGTPRGVIHRGRISRVMFDNWKF